VTTDHTIAERPPADRGLAVGYAESDRALPRVLLRPLSRFLHTEVAGGTVLVVAAVVALAWANSPWASGYASLWHTEVGLDIGGWGLHHSLHHWVNDGLMVIFFAVVGLEIKRELVHGHLRDKRAALLPVLAALGGMAVPGAIFFAINAGSPGADGWGIPMATDIAFALGVLALVGKRVPVELKVFLLGVAVADDIGAIIVIAVFYSSGVALTWLAAAGGMLGLIALAQRLAIRHLGVYVVLAVVAWLALLESGVHATLAGVAVGLLTPAHPFHRSGPVVRAVSARLRGAAGDQATVASDDVEHDEAVLWESARIAREGVSPLHRVEHSLHLWSAFAILPIFALANAGVPLSLEALSGGGASLAAMGAAAGLLVGKPVGIVGATLLATRLGVAKLPAGVGTGHVVGVGLLGGVGFTVALFVAGLAFPTLALTEAAKVGVLGGSLLAAVAGFTVLRLAGSPATAAAGAADPVPPAEERLPELVH
jgi:NhaA family Na+:H+ antiporter